MTKCYIKISNKLVPEYKVGPSNNTKLTDTLGKQNGSIHEIFLIARLTVMSQFIM